VLDFISNCTTWNYVGLTVGSHDFHNLGLSPHTSFVVYIQWPMFVIYAFTETKLMTDYF
jgi:hypothetical protein